MTIYWNHKRNVHALCGMMFGISKQPLHIDNTLPFEEVSRYSTLVRDYFVRTFACILALSVTLLEAEASETLFLTGVASLPPPTAARNLCKQYTWACSEERSGVLSREQEMKILKRLNRIINSSVPRISDQSQYKVEDRWVLPTLQGGDCEDFALLKKREALKAGVEPKSLFLATALDKNRNGHAVLIYRSEEGDLVLDNTTSIIKPWRETRYLFLRMQDPKQLHRWVGVYGGG